MACMAGAGARLAKAPASGIGAHIWTMPPRSKADGPPRQHGKAVIRISWRKGGIAVDCGFYLASFWLALGCMGLAALALEFWAWRLTCRTGTRIRLMMELDCAGLTAQEQARLQEAARRLRRLRWPGADISFQNVGEEGNCGTTTGTEDRGRCAKRDLSK